MEALSAILEAVQQQLDVQGAALQQLMEKLTRRRFECFKVRYEGQDFNNYETMVKAKCTDAHFDLIDSGLQCLFYVAGFQGSEFADYRT
ncbi:unnamed protein product, partial [Heligmosomoides polygyrus]|uniref:CULLIN_2 domain-containing protein n=1 Tax=Heligmosomoides polygyrus TaxID=6339 RepID=A0A183GWA0_HELPZ